jgi:hypothetical protein
MIHTTSQSVKEYESFTLKHKEEKNLNVEIHQRRKTIRKSSNHLETSASDFKLKSKERNSSKNPQWYPAGL